MSDERILRVLLVDDSATSRAAIGRLVAGSGRAVIVGEAQNGEEALAMTAELKPDVILLDIEMPRMDGFTFLRLQMARKPLPVIVVSANAQKSDVFKALELGALDFVPKPERGWVGAAGADLMAKCALVRTLRIENIVPRWVVEREPRRPAGGGVEPSRVAVIAASTGGPQAVQRLLEPLPGDLDLAILVAQHMPERFTRGFAERLARTTRFSASEAEGGEAVAAGRVLVAPGGKDLVLARDDGGVLRAYVLEPRAAPRGEPRYTPSADALLESAAATLGPRACAIVLTGMGRDGAAGARAVHAAGGIVMAESPESAVVYGMPEAAVTSGVVRELLPLATLTLRLQRFARGDGPDR